MENFDYTISIGQLGEQLTLNQWVLGSSPRWCTIKRKSERTSFRRCVRICFFALIIKIFKNHPRDVYHFPKRTFVKLHKDR